MTGGSDTTLSIYDDERDHAVPMVVASQLFLMLRADRPMAPARRVLLEGVRAVSLGRADGTELTLSRDKDQLQIGCPDARMSSRHAKIEVDGAGACLEDLGSKNGTYHNGARVTQAELQDGDVIEVGHTFFLFRGPSRTWADPDPNPRSVLGGALTTFVPAMEAAMRAVAEVSTTDVPVLVLGETGTGKEVVARASHEISGRKGNFVAVNCGALPEQLIESELFGVVRGAYSGAAEDRPGLIRAADKGTLFLDEIGELPLPAQVALLRILQEREVTPVGGTAPISVDFRLVCATHRDLTAQVEEENFRQDLYARIRGLEVRLPSLEDRREDLGLLVGALLSKKPESENLRLSRRAARALLAHRWPQNVRALEQALRLAIARATDRVIEVDHLPDDVGAALARTVSAPRPTLDPEDEARKEALLKLLAEHNGNVAAVARAMGKARMQIHRWMKRYGIDPRSMRS